MSLETWQECFYTTGFAFRFEHRKWNRGRNRLPKLVQTKIPKLRPLRPLFHFLCSNLRLTRYSVVCTYYSRARLQGIFGCTAR